MTTEREIDLQIGKEYNEFYTRIYDGLTPIPEFTVKLFATALMCVAPAAHQIHGDKMKLLISKKIEELTWVEVGKMMNVITEVPFYLLYEDLEDALNKTMQMEQFQLYYNATVADLDSKMKKKKSSLMNLGGVNRSSITMPIAKA